MLARVLAMAPCRSQVSVLLKQLNESSWFLAWGLLSIYPTLCCKEIQVPSKIRVLLWNFTPNTGLRKFRHSISIVEACYQLSLRKMDVQSAINLTVICQLS